MDVGHFRSFFAGIFISPVFSSYSHGNAAAVPWNTFNTVKARIGDKSIPPKGGITPRNKFRYGSHNVASGYANCLGGFGNHVKINRPINSVL